MGTNYYHYLSGERECSHCGQSMPNRHIGKSSAGWCFSLHTYPEDEIYGLEEWKRQWETGAIFDEYGTRVTPEQMLSVILDRSRPKGLTSHVGYRSA